MSTNKFRGRGMLANLHNLSLSSVSSFQSSQKLKPKPAKEDTFEIEDLPENALPIARYKNEIIQKINRSHVTLISAATGSGKSTQVPQYILEDAQKRGETCNILVSQPRKIGAVSLAHRLAFEMKCKLGSLVGYHVGLNKKVSKEDDAEDRTQLTFCTTGVVLEKLITHGDMSNYTHIILDEVHERDLDLDLLMMLAREYHLYRSKETKLILMSATFGTDAYVNYFTYSGPQTKLVPEVVDIKVKSPFKIEILFMDDIPIYPEIESMHPEIQPAIYEVAMNIIKDRLKRSQKSILVFLPGIHEIRVMRTMLSMVPSIADSFLICILHSSLSFADQQTAFMPSDKPKIILATNIAESSVTIRDCDCVIDFCITKYLLLPKDSTLASLQLTWASKDSLKQRAGRTGRTCDGTVYRLVYLNFFKEFLRNTSVPEMERCPLETTILRIKKLELEDISPPAILLRCMNPPTENAIKLAIRILKELGGLQRLGDDGKFTLKDGKLTYVGKIMSILPLDVHVTKFIILGYMFSVLDEAIIIGAGLNVKSIFTNSYTQSLTDYTQKLKWADGSGCDFMAILNAYKFWKYSSEQGAFKDWKEEKAWCERYRLERRSLIEMRDLIREIKNRLADENIKMTALTGSSTVTWTEREKPLILKMCIAGAFIPNLFLVPETNEIIEQDIYKDTAWKDPMNTVYFKCKEKVQVGALYENQVKRMLVDAGICNTAEGLKVTFDRASSKIFMEFANKDSKMDTSDYDAATIGMKLSVAGSVMPEVYKAVKIRQLGQRFSLFVMENDFGYAAEQGLGKIEHGSFEFNKNFYKYPELCAIPSTIVKELYGRVTHIEHCGKFWIQPFDQDNLEIVQNIAMAIKEDLPAHYNAVQELKVNQFVICYHEDVMKRARVTALKANSELVSCFMIDYGQTATFPVQGIMKVSDTIQPVFEISERCFQAYLSEIMPSYIKCPSGKWTKEAIEQFSEYLQDCKVKIEVHSIINNIAAVRLFVNGVDINQKLVQKGFARDCEEGLPRKLDNQIRTVIQVNKNRHFSPSIEFKQQPNPMIIENPTPPSMGLCKKRVTLVGPTSPLEVPVDSILGQGRPVIDPTSVNSVLLRDDPGNYYGRLMVAANVTQNKQSSVLHETTILPDIPGLQVLLALIFAPDVALKRNVDKTRYDFLRFGLGNEQGLPFFADHDCDLPVDIELDSEDFKEINNLRFAMSYLLLTQHNESVQTIKDEKRFEMFNNVKNSILSILSKERPILANYIGNSERYWLTDDQSDVVYHDLGGHYHTIPYPPLNQLEAGKAKELRDRVNRIAYDVRINVMMSTSTNDAIECPLCDRQFANTALANIHFNSKMHKNSFKILENENNEA